MTAPAFPQVYPLKNKRNKLYYRALFVLFLKRRKRMAKEKGLISPEDFAQLQQYMECESFSRPLSSGGFLFGTLHPSVPATWS